jgi:glucose-6-phosphate dehydrogenase assembly protein OpcA
MIIELKDTTSTQIQKRLIQAREEGGAVALGRVLTFLIHTDGAKEEKVIQAANDASREHPMRIVVISEPDTHSDSPGLDAEIRLGGDAGASEVVILRPTGQGENYLAGLVNGLLLPDAPVVTWWPDRCPDCMADTELGQMSQRRILDSLELGSGLDGLHTVAQGYRPGDTDLAWSRITGWRTQLAATLDYLDVTTIDSARVVGVLDNPSVMLLAGWLGLTLGHDVTVDNQAPEGTRGVYEVALATDGGEVRLTRQDDQIVQLRVPGQPDFSLFLPRRQLASLLAEELRRLAPDTVYGEVLTGGLRWVRHTTP